MAWNIEGLNRNIYNLKHFTENHQPDLIFLSKRQIFTHDVEHNMGYIKGKYNYSLITADKYDPVLPLSRTEPMVEQWCVGRPILIHMLPHILYHPHLSSQSFSSLLGAPSASISVCISQLLVRNLSLWKNFPVCPTSWKNWNSSIPKYPYS